jgi:glutathione S-transferase
MSTPNLTLYFLQASRSIRVAWLLEELNLPYESVFYPRINNKAPPNFKEDSGNALGKAPTLKDGELILSESGAITEFVPVSPLPLPILQKRSC